MFLNKSNYTKKTIVSLIDDTANIETINEIYENNFKEVEQEIITKGSVARISFAGKAKNENTIQEIQDLYPQIQIVDTREEKTEPGIIFSK